MFTVPATIIACMHDAPGLFMLSRLTHQIISYFAGGQSIRLQLLDASWLVVSIPTRSRFFFRLIHSGVLIRMAVLNRLWC